jgi:hypothetical protein
MKRRTEIIIETDRILVVGHRRTAFKAWCEACGAEVRMVTADEAAALARVGLRMVFRWVEDGSLHWVETDEGLLLICINSLSQNRHEPLTLSLATTDNNY